MRSHLIIAILTITNFSITYIYGQKFQRQFESIAEIESCVGSFNFVQDTNGLIWIVSTIGLVNYDGYEFNSTTATYDKDLDTGPIEYLKKDYDGNIWMNSYDGLARYNPILGLTDNFLASDKALNLAPYTFMLDFDTHNNLWLINPVEKNISRFDLNLHQAFPYPVYSDLRNFAVSRLDSSNWILSEEKKVYYWNAKIDTFTKVDIFDVKEISGLRSEHTGKIVLWQKDTIYIFHPATQRLINTYFREPKNENTLLPEKIYQVEPDKMGNLWVNYGSGNFTRIDPMGKLYHYRIGKNINKQSSFLNLFIYENKFGVFYGLNTTNPFKIIGRLNFDSLTNTLLLLEDIDFPTQNYFQWEGFLMDTEGKFWWTGENSLYRQSDIYQSIDLIANDDTITKLYSDNKDRIWALSEDGIIRITEVNDSFVFQKYISKEFEGKNRPFYQDSKGTIWVGTNHGLFYYHEDKNNFVKQALDLDGSNETITAIFEDSRTKLWIAKRNKGLYQIDNQTGKIINIFNFTFTNVLGEVEELLIGRIFEDSNGLLYITSYAHQNRLYRLNHKSDTFEHLEVDIGQVYDILEDHSQTLWIAGGNGVFYSAPNSTDFISVNDPQFYLTDELTLDRYGKIWATTYTGISSIDIENDTIIHYELTDTKVGILIKSGLHLDSNDNFWIPTSQGLIVFNINDHSVRKFNQDDGLTELITNSPILERENGKIILASKGINIIEVDKLLKRDTTPPKVFFRNLYVQDKKIEPAIDGILSQPLIYMDEIHLKHWQKDLSFDALAIHYKDSERNTYSWKLENYDTDWSTPSTNRNIKYTNLFPGTYRLMVKAANSDGVWGSQPKVLVIKIAPPLWKTLWAYIFYILIASGIFYWFLERIKKNQVRKERELQKDQKIAQAKVLEKAYNDLDVAHNNLKATQSQLIQSEKMASLGELTAGIAHEIQNPLNFVNNFSDVSTELIDEALDELDQGDKNEVKTILTGLKENLSKIHHHGGRASSIVKSMLNHSRSAGGKKELVDINKLCEEYLRLAYHGMRAKDNAFQAEYELQVEPDLPKIEAVPQDIGRVLLNLINNAFQACTSTSLSTSPERSRSILSTEGEAEGNVLNKPTVAVTTKKRENVIEIAISDNGPGIPEEIKDKIFQPFFTTKPTGQGTGLGLSLSYDIVKAHGGELKVETKQGEGSEFIIKLPMV